MDTIKELYKPSMEELTKMHKQIMGLVTWKLNQLAGDYNSKKPIKTSDIKDCWEIVKTEKNEPTKVSKVDGEIDTGPATIVIVSDVQDLLQG
jgi:hypothetical protein